MDGKIYAETISLQQYIKDTFNKSPGDLLDDCDTGNATSEEVAFINKIKQQIQNEYNVSETSHNTGSNEIFEDNFYALISYESKKIIINTDNESIELTGIKTDTLSANYGFTSKTQETPSGPLDISYGDIYTVEELMEHGNIVFGDSWETTGGLALSLLWELSQLQADASFEDLVNFVRQNPQMEIMLSGPEGIIQVNESTINEESYPENDMTPPSEFGDNDDSEDGGALGLLFDPIISLLLALTDGVNALMEFFVIGDEASSWFDIILDYNDFMANLSANGRDIEANLPAFKISDKWLKKGIANISLTPVEIFSGKVAMLNANFFKTNQQINGLIGSNRSIISQLKQVVSGWYLGIRNIAIVGLLSVLLYIGIRIVISSNINDKVKYRQSFVDWLVALCLIFFIHYIMAFTMTISEEITSMLAGNSRDNYITNQVTVVDENGTQQFSTNFTNAIRTKAAVTNPLMKIAYFVLYVAFTGYTAYFTIIYIKRLLIIMFYTMIAPAVALTYPIDKVKDSRAQAFQFWLKEYIFYALQQPLHMLIYTILVTSALQLSVNNLLYTIIAIAAIVPIEKLIKQMFGIQGSTEDKSGGFVGGAVASTLFNAINKNRRGGHNTHPNNNNDKVKIANNPNKTKVDDRLIEGENTNENDALGQYENNQETQWDNNQVQYATSQVTAQQNTEGQVSTDSSNSDNSARVNGQNPQDIEGRNDDRATSNIPPKGYYTDLPSRQTVNKKKIKGPKTNFGKAVRKRWIAAGGTSGIGMSALKTTGRVLGTAIGATAIGAVGLGIGMVGGNPSDTIKGLAAGAVAGGYIGNKTSNAIGNTIGGKNAVGSFASEVINGDNAENKRYRNDYINNKEVISRIADKHEEMSIREAKQYAARMYDMMYEAGSDNEDLAEKAIEREDQLINSGESLELAHKRAVLALNGSKSSTYSADKLRDKEKFNNARESMIERSIQRNGITRQQAERETDIKLSDMAAIQGIKGIETPYKIQQNSSREIRRNTNIDNNSNQTPSNRNTGTAIRINTNAAKTGEINNRNTGTAIRTNTTAAKTGEINNRNTGITRRINTTAAKTGEINNRNTGTTRKINTTKAKRGRPKKN